MSKNIVTEQGIHTWTDLKGKSTHRENQQSVTKSFDYITNIYKTLMKTNIVNKSKFSTSVYVSTAQTS